jgi:hypothetical protein
MPSANDSCLVATPSTIAASAQIQTDSRNVRSQAAIARLGAVREGALRRHFRRADGSFRDTVVFSILITEWPGVRRGLDARIARGIRINVSRPNRST